MPYHPLKLLHAKHCVAGDMVSHAPVRNRMACTATGQELAAAVASRQGRTTADVDGAMRPGATARRRRLARTRPAPGLPLIFLPAHRLAAHPA